MAANYRLRLVQLLVWPAVVLAAASFLLILLFATAYFDGPGSSESVVQSLKWDSFPAWVLAEATMIGVFYGLVSYIVNVRPPEPSSHALESDAQRIREGVTEDKEWTLGPLRIDGFWDVPLSRVGSVDQGGEIDVDKVAEHLQSSGAARVVIQGGEGSGKSVLLRRIQDSILGSDHLRAPVILPCADWRYGADLVDWVGDQLRMRHTGLTARMARKLASSDRLVVLLDALDELVPEDEHIADANDLAGDLIRAINEASST